MVLWRLVTLMVAFVALSLFFWALQHLWPSVKEQKTLRRGFWTDCVYWLWTPIITRGVTPFVVAVVLLPIALYFRTDLRSLLHGHGPLAVQPLWLQAAEIFVAGDFVGYWQHRLFHRTSLWRFHAIHHSSSELDWLSSVRLHPVNDLLSRLIVSVPLVAVGFNASVVAIYAPFTTFYAVMIHANLNWDYGVFRYVIASPTFHRWHHTKEAEGMNKNFAGALPLWDLLFGTFYMPRGRQPSTFGIDGPMPSGFIGQLVSPFRHRSGAVGTPDAKLLASAERLR